MREKESTDEVHVIALVCVRALTTVSIQCNAIRDGHCVHICGVELCKGLRQYGARVRLFGRIHFSVVKALACLKAYVRFWFVRRECCSSSNVRTLFCFFLFNADLLYFVFCEQGCQTCNVYSI